MKRNNRKRQRDEKLEKVSEKEKSPTKRPKTDDSPPVAKEGTSNKDKDEALNVVSESTKSAKEDVSDKTDPENCGIDGSSGGRDEAKIEDKATDEDMIDEDEDPEEIIDDEEEADDDSISNDVQKASYD